ncbi:MAG: hypothetical protein V3575_04030 [Candidatus Absconditabacteria bacterium]
MSLENLISCLPLSLVLMAWLYNWIHKFYHMKFSELVKFDISNIGTVPFWIKVKFVAMLFGSVALKYFRSRLLPAFVFSLIFVSLFVLVFGIQFSIFKWIILMFAVEVSFILLVIYVWIMERIFTLAAKI